MEGYVETGGGFFLIFDLAVFIGLSAKEGLSLEILA